MLKTTREIIKIQIILNIVLGFVFPILIYDKKI